MKSKWTLLGSLLALLLLALAVGLARAQGPAPSQPVGVQAALGTAFTYQGQLKKDGSPYSGNCDFRFSLWDAATGGTQIGSTQTKTGVSVSNGLFTIADLDFGSGAFTGDARWLQIAVRCPAGSGSYTPLSPRQPLTPAPYALALPGLWTQQNATSPNLIGGYSGNSVTGGAVGATVGGGGASGNVNRVTDNYGTVGGGSDNQAGDNVGAPDDCSFSTVGGGDGNTASGWAATVGGGHNNNASNRYATVGGGRDNTATGQESTICGGRGNQANSIQATVCGGWENAAYNANATVCGGQGNLAGYYATVGGGFYNRANGSYATIGGGAQNTASGAGAYVGGGGVDGTTVSGNQADGNASTIGGGTGNIASGSYATIGGGTGNIASGDSYATVSGGISNTASGITATVGGGWGNIASGDTAATVSGGVGNTAGGDFSTVPGGYNAAASHYGEMAYAGGRFANPGDAQTSLYVMRIEQTCSVGTWYDLYLNGNEGGSFGYLTIAPGRTVALDALVVGRTQAGESAGYYIRGVVENVGGTVSFIGAPSVTVLGEDDTAWNVRALASDTYDALFIQVQGNGETIRWVATVRTVEVSW